MVFPNLRGKHGYASMFSPNDWSNYLKKRKWFMYFGDAKGAIIFYDTKIADNIKHKFENKSDVISGRYFQIREKGSKIIAVKSDMGSPSAAAVLEELVIFGVKRFINIGTAGGLQKFLKVGDFILCDKSIRDEGTSHHYLKSSKYAYPSEELTSKLEQNFVNEKLKFYKGASWTIDAPFRETVREGKLYQKEGILSVEMETSAIFSVAKYRNVEASSAFVVSDMLANFEWQPSFHHKKLYKNLWYLFKLAKNCLVKNQL